MVSNSELRELIREAQEEGALVSVTNDTQALREEGRDLVLTVTVCNWWRGIGPFPMSPISAAERLRAALRSPSPV